MVFKPLKNLIRDLEAAALAPIAIGMGRSAEAIVRDLQVKGPIWSGKFSNSWQISSPSNTVTGAGQADLPIPLRAPVLLPNEVKFKPEVKYRITNTAPYADVALDLREGERPFIYPGFEPRKAAVQGIRRSGIRGDVPNTGTGPNRRTAELDWYTTYLRGKQIDSTIRLYMDEAFREARR
jgi:hypothetical protein